MVPTPVVRRAAALAGALALSIAASGLALADTVAADGDAVTAGNQASVDLGEVTPGAVLTVDVVLRLACRNANHAAAGSVIVVGAASVTVPDDGILAVIPGRIAVPATWPATGDGCPLGIEPVAGDVPVRLAITAPTSPGPDRSFSVLFGLSPADGVSNLAGFSVSLDVVEAAPVDTTAPVLSGLPSDILVFTAGPDAIVAWPMPTAADDTDPSPAVTCTPASGSAFAVGTTTVTCTATDAAGNASEGTFDVTVRRLAATWGRPLGDGMPALTGQPGRTIPLKLIVRTDGLVHGPAEMPVPTLRLERLVACDAGGGVLESLDAGPFRWDDGTWHLQLGTGGLGTGCWRLTALVDGAPLAHATVRLVAGGDGGRTPRAA